MPVSDQSFVLCAPRVVNVIIPAADDSIARVGEKITALEKLKRKDRDNDAGVVEEAATKRI